MLFHASLLKSQPVLKDDEALNSEERQLLAAILEAVKRIQNNTVRTQVSRALAENNIRGALEAIAWSDGQDYLESTLPEQIRRVYEVAGRDASREMAADLRVVARFDLLNPHAVTYVRGHAGELITQFQESSQNAVRAVIERMFTEGITPARGARLLIDSGIGLTDRMAAAVDRYRVSQEADGVTQAMAESRAARYAKRLLRSRAETIARTEIITAQRAGQQEAWRQAADKGLLNTQTATQTWLAVRDSRTDDECLEMDGKTARLGEPFQSPDGPVWGPALHPRCRCTLVLNP